LAYGRGNGTDDCKAKKAKKQTTRGRKQDCARVAGKQRHEVSYEAKKIGRFSGAEEEG
jgi:hypothetical protein